jgi:hypothetical protein
VTYSAGSHSITAAYGGSSAYTGSSSSTVTVAVAGTSGGSGGGGTSTLSAAQIIALLGPQLTPSGRAAKIANLLKSGAFTLSLKAPGAGVLVIGWYEIPPGAKLARAKAKPVLIASGQASFASAAAGKIKIKLTTAGKKLLKHAHSLKITAKATFTPTGGAAVSTRRSFTLHH